MQPPTGKERNSHGNDSPQRMNAGNHVTPQSQIETPIVREDADKSIKRPESNTVPINLRRVYQKTLTLYPTQKQKDFTRNDCILSHINTTNQLGTPKVLEKTY